MTKKLACLGCCDKHMIRLEHVLDDMLMSSMIDSPKDEEYLISQRKRMRNYRKHLEDWIISPEMMGLSKKELIGICPTCSMKAMIIEK